jgi:ankyrin repeat protein
MLIFFQKTISQHLRLLTISLSTLYATTAIAIGPPPDADHLWRGPDGSTALQWAVYEQDITKVASLLRAGADPKLGNDYGSTPLGMAAEVGNTELIKLLIDAGADIDSPNLEGQTALMLVARTGNIEAANILLKNGATINARESWGEQTALMWAAARGHPEMVALLLASGADGNATSIARDYRRHLTKEGRAKNLDSGGLSSLMFAIRENCLGCIKELLNFGVDINLTDPDGVSPLLLAIMNSHWDAAMLLIEAGADIKQWDTFGQTPLLAIIPRHQNRSLDPGEHFDKHNGTEVLESLLKNGADVNFGLFLRPAKQRGGPLSRGTTPLILAASQGDVEVIKLLLANGADATLAQADLQTPLSSIAGARGQPDTLVEGVKILLAAGADPNVRAVPHHLQRTRGGRPLHYAVGANNREVVEALVAGGADLNGKDIDGLTALDHARARDQVPFLRMRQATNTKMVELLLSLGETQNLAIEELDTQPFWPNVGPPFYYPWHVFPLDATAELNELVPGSIDHQ